MHAAWGNGAEVDRCVQEAITDYEQCINTEPADSFEGLAALTKLIREFRMWYRGEERITSFIRSLEDELAQRILRMATASPHKCSFLIRGILVATDFETPWQPLHPGEPSPFGAGRAGVVSQMVFGGYETVSAAGASIGIPSAFSLFLRTADYGAAHRLVIDCPDYFRYPSLAGWPPALRGLLRLSDPATDFEEAAALFAADGPPTSEQEWAERGGSWSGENQQLWAKYFTALSSLERAKADPAEVKRLVANASSALEGTESGLVNPQVSRLRVFVRALAGLLGVEPSLRLDQAKQELKMQGRIFGTEESDVLGLEFLQTTEMALERFHSNPARALGEGDLESVLRALEKLPLLGSDLARAVRPALGDAALSAILGPHNTWIHRALESIKDESMLRRLILRLLQADKPLYAQIRHGPIEYGKDVAVVLEIEGRQVLRMYQAKTKDITVPVWRTAQHELEEMYLVALDELQIQGRVDSREGILLCNGHANTFVEPLIGPWIKEQARAYGRAFKFMHLDDLVGWITRNGLVNEFKAIASELNLPT